MPSASHPLIINPYGTYKTCYRAVVLIALRWRSRPTTHMGSRTRILSCPVAQQILSTLVVFLTRRTTVCCRNESSYWYETPCTGCTTRVLAPILANLKVPVEYVITNLSPSIVSQACRSFRKIFPRVSRWMISRSTLQNQYRAPDLSCWLVMPYVPP
ncbi:hypothetical protein F4680DRAFT_124350 [Xylaria scruposa]|nr:hypothetical protein F4680DRAFT_124350 [Xylaria scruposa]